MKDYKFTVYSTKMILPDVLELRLNLENDTMPQIVAGQFVHLSIPNTDNMLRRPFCLYKWDKKTISLLIHIVGSGTKKLAQLKKSDIIYGIMPIGNGFTISAKQKKIALVGGGIGVAPLLMVPNSCLGREADTIAFSGKSVMQIKKTIKGTEIRSYLGFTTKARTILSTGFSGVSEKLTITTDDGTHGTKGYPTDALEKDIEAGFVPDVILCCGNHALVKAVKNLCQKHNIEGFMTGEERMGCGIGACLVCTCNIKKHGSDTIEKKRACIDGPVFNLSEVQL